MPAFESEVRYAIPDIAGFERRLKALGGKLEERYSFYDHYYQPAARKWNPTEKILRVREWRKPLKPSTIYFAKNEVVSLEGLQFKRSLYQSGKLALFTGRLAECKRLLADLGFKPWMVIRKKEAHKWDLAKHGFKTVVEHVEGLGWSGELEAEGADAAKAKAQLERALGVLGISKRAVSFKPLSVIFTENSVRKPKRQTR